MFSSNTSQVSNDAVFVEDVFSTWLYTGNGSTQTITNGIDLAGKGGLVWIKDRTAANLHYLTDTARGNYKTLNTNNTSVQYDASPVGPVLNSSGFSIGNWTAINDGTPDYYASWTFRKQPKFFDVVTYTGTGTSGLTVNHNLGSVPGCIIIKRTDANSTDGWYVYHRSATSGLALNKTNAEGGVFGNLVNTLTSTSFNVATTVVDANANGGTYVAYLFAHNAGGFGLTGTDNVISCGITDSGGNAILGFEPQWILAKDPNNVDNWKIIDTMRGWRNGSTDNYLFANTSGAEGTNGGLGHPTATGFTLDGGTHIYIAIRRGPMKTPTSGTSVFAPVASSAASGTALTTNFPVDTQFGKYRSGSASWSVVDRLRGVSTTSTEMGLSLATNSTAAEGTASGGDSNNWGSTGFSMPSNLGGISDIFYNLRRAPGFFDVVCYTGDGTLNPRNHNLTVTPELVIVKRRSSDNGWYVSQYLSSPSYGQFNTTAAFTSQGSSYPVTSTTFVPVANTSGQTLVAYLFASCPGVSKVGSYTGTGATQTISCGFTGGARFVLIKRTDSTGDWYVWDTARGMVSGTDPSLMLNSTAAEVNANSIYTTTGGFQIVSTAAGINASGGSYIFLAIA